MAGAADEIQEHLAAGRERKRAEMEFLATIAARLSAGWAASGRNMSAREAVAEAQGIITEAERVIRTK